MKSAFLAITLAWASGLTHAACTGSGAFSYCTDSSGNSYNVQRIGNQTYVQGSNSRGDTWSQNSQTIGNITYHNGTAANGNSWSGTTQRIGNTTYSSGIDSRGNPYSGSSYAPSDNYGYGGHPECYRQHLCTTSIRHPFYFKVYENGTREGLWSPLSSPKLVSSQQGAHLRPRPPTLPSRDDHVKVEVVSNSFEGVDLLRSAIY